MARLAAVAAYIAVILYALAPELGRVAELVGVQ